MNLTKSQKQQIINDITNHFRRCQWFNGVGFMGSREGYLQETIVIAFNFYPVLELKDVKEYMLQYDIPYELKDYEKIKQQ